MASSTRGSCHRGRHEQWSECVSVHSPMERVCQGTLTNGAVACTSMYSGLIPHPAASTGTSGKIQYLILRTLPLHISHRYITCSATSGAVHVSDGYITCRGQYVHVYH